MKATMLSFPRDSGSVQIIKKRFCGEPFSQTFSKLYGIFKKLNKSYISIRYKRWMKTAEIGQNENEWIYTNDE